MFRHLKKIFWEIMRIAPPLRPVYETRHSQTPVPLNKLLRFLIARNKHPYWPMHESSVAVDTQRIHIGIETSPGLMPNCYIQGTNGIYIGNYTQIAAGVKIISANHSLVDNRVHVVTPPVEVGDYCWLGASAVILPGVKLGEYTVVGAGAVVTKSFPDGYSVIAGNPAKLIRRLEETECIKHQSQYRYHGFIPAEKFDLFKKKNLVTVCDD